MEGGDAGVITRAGFVRGQTMLYAPILGRLVPPSVIEAFIDVAAAHPWLASLLRRAPLPNLLFAEDDFDDVTFQQVLRSHVMHRGPRQLFEELLACIARGEVLATHGGLTARIPHDLASARPFELLTITSKGDRFVPSADVLRAHTVVRGGQAVLCEEEFGTSSGHIGYFVKQGLYPRVFSRIGEFLSR